MAGDPNWWRQLICGKGGADHVMSPHPAGDQGQTNSASKMLDIPPGPTHTWSKNQGQLLSPVHCFDRKPIPSVHFIAAVANYGTARTG